MTASRTLQQLTRLCRRTTSIPAGIGTYDEVRKAGRRQVPTYLGTYLRIYASISTYPRLPRQALLVLKKKGIGIHTSHPLKRINNASRYTSFNTYHAS